MTLSAPSDRYPESLPHDRTASWRSGADGPRLQALLEEWVLLRDQGKEVPAAELCRDCPHLAETLAGEIALHMRFEPAAPVEAARPEPPVKEFAGLRYQPLRYHAQG